MNLSPKFNTASSATKPVESMPSLLAAVFSPVAGSGNYQANFQSEKVPGAPQMPYGYTMT
jgi:hypothetical protein